MFWSSLSLFLDTRIYSVQCARARFRNARKRRQGKTHTHTHTRNRPAVSHKPTPVTARTIFNIDSNRTGFCYFRVRRSSFAIMSRTLYPSSIRLPPSNLSFLSPSSAPWFSKSMFVYERIYIFESQKYEKFNKKINVCAEKWQRKQKRNEHEILAPNKKTKSGAIRHSLDAFEIRFFFFFYYSCTRLIVRIPIEKSYRTKSTISSNDWVKAKLWPI